MDNKSFKSVDDVERFLAAHEPLGASVSNS